MTETETYDIQTVGDHEGDPVAYFAKGHHDLEEFRARTARDWGLSDIEDKAVSQEYWRWVPKIVERGWGRERTLMVSRAKAGTRGAFPVTVLSLEGWSR